MQNQKRRREEKKNMKRMTNKGRIKKEIRIAFGWIEEEPNITTWACCLCMPSATLAWMFNVHKPTSSALNLLCCRIESAAFVYHSVRLCICCAGTYKRCLYPFSFVFNDMRSLNPFLFGLKLRSSARLPSFWFMHDLPSTRNAAHIHMSMEIDGRRKIDER